MPRIATRKTSRSDVGRAIQDQALGALTRLWILRLLVPLQGHRKFIGKGYFSEDDLARALGLGDWVSVDGDEFDPKAILKILRAQHQEAECDRLGAALNDGLLK